MFHLRLIYVYQIFTFINFLVGYEPLILRVNVSLGIQFFFESLSFTKPHSITKTNLSSDILLLL